MYQMKSSRTFLSLRTLKKMDRWIMGWTTPNRLNKSNRMPNKRTSNLMMRIKQMLEVSRKTKLTHTNCLSSTRICKINHQKSTKKLWTFKIGNNLQASFQMNLRHQIRGEREKSYYLTDRIRNKCSYPLKDRLRANLLPGISQVSLTILQWTMNIQSIS